MQKALQKAESASLSHYIVKRLQNAVTAKTQTRMTATHDKEIFSDIDKYYFRNDHCGGSRGSVLVVFTKQGEAPNLGGYTVFRITTGSMRPSYDTDT